jgi:hypothetical protein
VLKASGRHIPAIAIATMLSQYYNVVVKFQSNNVCCKITITILTPQNYNYNIDAAKSQLQQCRCKITITAMSAAKLQCLPQNYNCNNVATKLQLRQWLSLNSNGNITTITVALLQTE